MVSCNQQPNEDGDYVCGWDEGDDFCIGYHCEVCSISLCSPDCGDEYCARTRSPADREQTKCMLCAHPLEDEEYDTDLETWVKDGKKIEWDGLSFSYPCEECGIDPCDCTNYSADAEYNVEFNDWADQEMNSHGKNISFKDWSKDEGLKHGNTEITEWAQHEDESHDARYGAEEYAESFATEGKSFVCDACEETLPLKLRNRSKKVAQEFGMGMGDICRPCVKRIKSYEEEDKKLNPPKNWADYYNAPTKGIDTFAKPFEEASLDSGGTKKVLLGIGLGIIGYFGYDKWK